MNTNKSLIPVSSSEINGETIQTVNARELHTFLKVGKDFSTWIKDRINQYSFQENQDFISFHQNGGKPQGGRPVVEYHISLDMAKELSMVERNEKGKQARQYFIECERIAREPRTVDVHEVLNDPSAMRGLLLSYTEKVLALEAENKELMEDSAALSRIAKSDGSLCITDAAKTLQIRPKNLFAWLQRHGWIYKRIGCAHYCAYQDKLNKGLMEHKATTVLRSDGTDKNTIQARVTPEGLEKLAKLLPPEITEVAVNE
ncbi:Phage anti-repressor protein [Nitrosomonas aestuarii]|uniref:Phage anti-repressor protein n=1 Tax=Nitrosomonas aestuarii TaxID=52441 RepID=A0A1I4G4J6_9PROT|nr:antA/AntB antirepressor family protein [Nitrosomonas aestuarii]SFL24197.1 Phage anti-repressor protein [Nitrosomonas aestuarii]